MRGSSVGGPIGRRGGGFTLLETTVVVAVMGIIIAMSVPKIAGAMRNYRLRIAVRQIQDLIQRAKMQAVSNNAAQSISIDAGGSRIGLDVYDSAGTYISTNWVPLPQGISFAIPTGVTAPITNAPTAAGISFPLASGSTTVYRQVFTSRGFPSVAGGTVNALYLSNGDSYWAVTLTCVGGLHSWLWNYGAWTSSHA